MKSKQEKIYRERLIVLNFKVVFKENDDVYPRNGEGPRIIFTKMVEVRNGQPKEETFVLYPPDEYAVLKVVGECETRLREQKGSTGVQIVKHEDYYELGIERNGAKALWDLYVKQRWKPLN